VEDPALPVKALADETDGGNPDMTRIHRDVEVTATPAYAVTESGAQAGAPDTTASNGIDHKPVVSLTHPASDSKDTHVLPTAPAVHPEAQADALAEEDPHVVAKEVEKMKADRREVEGKEPGGTIIQGLEDDKLWTLLRRFDLVSRIVKVSRVIAEDADGCAIFPSRIASDSYSDHDNHHYSTSRA
jgi:hypothetical protein